MKTNKADMDDTFDCSSDISSNYEEITAEPVLIQVVVGSGEYLERFHVHDNFLGSQSGIFKNLVRNVSNHTLYISDANPSCFFYFLKHTVTGDYNIGSHKPLDSANHNICGCHKCLLEKADDSPGIESDDDGSINIMDEVSKYVCKPNELRLHAELWVFADKYELNTLSELGCSYMKSPLDKTSVNTQNVRDIVNIVRDIYGYKKRKRYNSITTGALEEEWKKLRAVLCGFCTREGLVLKSSPEFLQLIKEGGQFCVDFQKYGVGQ